jgi:hypothetical protein
MQIKRTQFSGVDDCSGKSQPPGLPAAKITHDAEIRSEAATHKPGFSTAVEAHGRSAFVRRS